MRFRDQVALTLPALVLRVMLAAIFIWAGLGKVAQSSDVPPDVAAHMASLGIPLSTPPAPPPADPARRLPEPETPAQPEAGQAAPEQTEPADDPAPPQSPLPDPAGEPDADPAADPADAADDPADASQAAAAPGWFTLLPAAFVQETEPTRSLNQTSPDAASPAPAPAPVQSPVLGGRAYTAADFPDGARVLNVYHLALLLHSAAHPGLDENSAPRPPIWPVSLGSGAWPRILAWAVALTEIIAGVLVLFGLLTRLGAVALMSIMLGAMWLTEIGPALQSGNTTLGFLPNYPPFAMEWQHLQIHFILFMAALALFLLGPGAVSIDRALFRARRDDYYDDAPIYTDAPAGAGRRPV